LLAFSVSFSTLENIGRACAYLSNLTPPFIEFELLGGFGALVDCAPRCLTLTRMFIVSIIGIIFGAARRVRRESQPLKLARGA
jgi:hypothetical protein